MSVRALAVVTAVLFSGALAGRTQSAGLAAGTGGLSSLQNETLSLQTDGSDGLRLTNKLTGKSFDIAAAPFELLLEIGGRTFPADSSDFATASVVRPAPDLLRVRYEGRGISRGWPSRRTIASRPRAGMSESSSGSSTAGRAPSSSGTPPSTPFGSRTFPCPKRRRTRSSWTGSSSGAWSGRSPKRPCATGASCSAISPRRRCPPAGPGRARPAASASPRRGGSSRPSAGTSRTSGRTVWISRRSISTGSATTTPDRGSPRCWPTSRPCGGSRTSTACGSTSTIPTRASSNRRERIIPNSSPTSCRGSRPD